MTYYNAYVCYKEVIDVPRYKRFIKGRLQGNTR
jgi:hypothetical protein